MSDRRILRHCAFLALPMAALVGFGIYFLLASVPRIVANEHVRVESEARQIVDEMRRSERKPSFVWEYGAGVTDGEVPAGFEFGDAMKWKDWESGALRKGTAMWGISRRRKGPSIVWFRDGKCIYASCAELSETDFATLFWIGGPVVLLLLIATTVFAVASLYSYAKTRDDFLAAAAHDLTTPLIGMRFLLGRDPEGAKSLNDRMIRLVDNIRDFLSHGGNQRTPRLTSVDLDDTFAAAYAIFAADYREEVSGDIEIVGERGLVANADEGLTIQILWNLIGNDLKYAAPYGKVSAIFDSDGAFAKISLSDNGKGMTRRQMRHAFDRYWRAKNVLTSGKGGFGIGLCTSREFARSMGGDLTVRRNDAGGCVFELRLPLAQKDATAAKL
jgi:signal transduction histidine kinase